jgi:hypothetical protein
MPVVESISTENLSMLEQASKAVQAGDLHPARAAELAVRSGGFLIGTTESEEWHQAVEAPHGFRIEDGWGTWQRFTEHGDYILRATQEWNIAAWMGICGDYNYPNKHDQPESPFYGMRAEPGAPHYGYGPGKDGVQLWGHPELIERVHKLGSNLVGFADVVSGPFTLDPAEEPEGRWRDHWIARASCRTLVTIPFNATHLPDGIKPIDYGAYSLFPFSVQHAGEQAFE